MKNLFIARTGLILVLLGLIALVCLFAIGQGIPQWVNGGAAALGACIIVLTGCVFGWVSFKIAEGKIAAILGTCFLLLFFAGHFMSSVPTGLPQNQSDDLCQPSYSLQNQDYDVVQCAPQVIKESSDSTTPDP